MDCVQPFEISFDQKATDKDQLGNSDGACSECNFPSLFSNNVGAASLADPDFMQSTSVDIDPTAHAKSLFGGILILGISDGELAIEDEMGGEAVVGMWGVVCISGWHVNTAAMDDGCMNQPLDTSLKLKGGTVELRHTVHPSR